MKMKLCGLFAFVVTLAAMSPAHSEDKKDAADGKEKLIGAWRLAWLDEPGADGKIIHITDAKGSLIYTADGQVSVQVMYATAESNATSSPVQYAQRGYEASFGRFVVDEAAHTVTHHYDGSLVRSLLNKDFPRMYSFADGKLIIKSTRPDEHWAVGWERK